MHTPSFRSGLAAPPRRWQLSRLAPDRITPASPSHHPAAHDLPIDLAPDFAPPPPRFTLSVFTELSEFIDWAGNNAGAASGFIFAGAGLAFAFNLTGFCLVQTTSATTTAICGNVVVVIVIVLGSVFLQVEATPINIVGYCVSITAAIVYVGINLYQKKQQPAPEVKSPVVGVAVK